MAALKLFLDSKSDLPVYLVGDFNELDRGNKLCFNDQGQLNEDKSIIQEVSFRWHFFGIQEILSP